MPYRHPSLYEVNTRVWLGERGRRLGRRATLDDVDDGFLDEVATRGFGWIWFLGLWQTGPAGRAVSRSEAGWLDAFRSVLPDLSEEDVVGSPFAVTGYTVHSDFGGDEALARLRARAASRGVRLVVDFVPNHTALDHPWATTRPELYVQGSEDDLARAPRNWVRVRTAQGERILAHGRDPYFDGWPDTLQLDYRSAALRAAQVEVLEGIARAADGARCDMAMLLLPEVIEWTWGERSLPADGSPPADRSFWLDAVPAARGAEPGFLLVAEVYWDLEPTVLDEGFDHAYDKNLYDHLAARDAGAVRDRLRVAPDVQARFVRFLENHDEARAAAVFPPDVHEAAAVVTYLAPGMRLFHEGQFEGRKVHVPVHLARRPAEPVDAEIAAFYERLLAVLRRDVVHDGSWRLLGCRAAWDGNPTADHFVAFIWELAGRPPLVVAVNYGPTQGQCYVPIPLDGVTAAEVDLVDLTGPARYRRSTADLRGGGLYLDVTAWAHHVFEVRPAQPDPVASAAAGSVP